MIPYKWLVATAVPQNPAVRRDIAKAMQSFLENGDEQLRQRRAEIASIRQGLTEIAQDIAKFRRDAPALLLSELQKYGYNPDEPRVPKHQTGGGEWTHIAGSDDPNKASDAPGPDILYQKYGRGHHWVTRKIFEKRNFSNEVKAYFDDARSGALADPRANYNTKEHRAYNDAVDDLLNQYLKQNNIAEEQMTLEQAGEFLQEVKTSSVPAIRNFVIKDQ
jgi:hypothetical protein